MIPLLTVGPICCAEKIEEPKINIPRQLNKRIKVPVNEKIHLSVPFQGDKPINTDFTMSNTVSGYRLTQANCIVEEGLSAPKRDRTRAKTNCRR